jgi:hypothetical protein
VEERDIAANGYDLPPLISMSDFKVWSEVEPPKGTVYNYPMRLWHDAHENITAYPAPPGIAAQMYSRAIHQTMMAKVYSGQSNKEASLGRATNWKASCAEVRLTLSVQRCPVRRRFPEGRSTVGDPGAR